MKSIKEKYSGKTLTTDEVAVCENEIREAIKELESIRYNKGEDYLLLKWGTWKSWRSENPKVIELLKEYHDLGETESAMLQKNTQRQKDILCEVIDLIDGVIQNDWDGEYYTKEKAKQYIREYDSK